MTAISAGSYGQHSNPPRLFSPPEQIKRTIRIYTPDGYEQSDRPFPVLYVFDGQNIFVHPESATDETWCINRTLEKLVAKGEIQP